MFDEGLISDILFSFILKRPGLIKFLENEIFVWSSAVSLRSLFLEIVTFVGDLVFSDTISFGVFCGEC